jgi:hypothetical protein
LKVYRVWSVDTHRHIPMWIMDEFNTKRAAIKRGKQIILDASNETLAAADVMICRAAISIDNSPDHDCIYLKADSEVIGVVIEAVTSGDSDEDLIYLLTQVIAENFKETDNKG